MTAPSTDEKKKVLEPSKTDFEKARQWTRSYNKNMQEPSWKTVIMAYAQGRQGMRSEVVDLATKAGQELADNGLSLQKYDPGTRLEGRVREVIGMELLGLAECLILENGDHPIDRQIEDLRDRVRELVKDDPEALALLDGKCEDE